MSAPVDVLAVYVAEAPLERDDLTAALAAVVELVEAAKGAQPYLMPSDAARYRDAGYLSPADRLRQEADAIEAKDAAIRRFNAALSKFGEG